ncbi:MULTISPECIES: TolC family protein [Sulfurimonas]|uniref:TolC family protein n=1 Tax=Sulfurimonas TaxID=202746 RepID=UPI0012644B12|nr:TolC family protein [Sulfurimonas indica]
MKKIISILSFALLLNANDTMTDALSLNQALDILKSQNLEIKAAKLDIKSAQAEADSVSGMNWGKLTFTQDVARSDDAGNVFGFKLTSREATFGDFGFADFLSPPPGTTDILKVQPNDLNYPEDRNFFQSKLKYEVPLFTGFAISSYTKIMNEMTRLKTLDKEKILTEKTYELRKSYYDMALLNSSIKNLNKILENINTLERTTQTMIDVGYAKHVDLLEVKAKKGNVARLLIQMEANKKLLYHYISFLLNQKVDAIIPPASEVAMPNFTNEEILKRNIDIQKANTGLEIRKSMLDASQAVYYPTLGAFGEVATADDTFLGDANDHKAYTVGARLTWNLFNGGIDSAKVEKSKIEQLKMKSQVELAKHGIALKLDKIRTEIESSNAQIASLKKELELANAIYENYEGRYKEKLVSMSDVIIKQSAQIEKILQLQVAKNKRIEKIFALEKLANGDK